MAETEELTQTKKPVGGRGWGNGAPNRSISASKILSGLHCGPRAAQQARERRCPDEQDIRSTARTLSVPEVHGLRTFTLFTGGPSSVECLERTGLHPKDTGEARDSTEGHSQVQPPHFGDLSPLTTFLETHPCVTSPCGLPLCSSLLPSTAGHLYVLSAHLSVWNCLSASSPSGELDPGLSTWHSVGYH